MRTRLLLVVVLILAGGLVAALVREDVLPTVDGLPVVPAGADVHGVSMAEWSARHWQWTLGIPIATNPGQDVTGATCGEVQEAPVYFIPRNFPPCEVPAGWSIFIPIVGTECSTVEAPPYHGETPYDLRACAARDVDRYTGIIVRINGELVPEIADYRVASPPFSLILPERNVLGAPAGDAVAVADGYQVILALLPPGEHEIVVHVELDDGTVLPDKVLRLTVVP